MCVHIWLCTVEAQKCNDYEYIPVYTTTRTLALKKKKCLCVRAADLERFPDGERTSGLALPLMRAASLRAASLRSALSLLHAASFCSAVRKRVAPADAKSAVGTSFE